MDVEMSTSHIDLNMPKTHLNYGLIHDESL